MSIWERCTLRTLPHDFLIQYANQCEGAPLSSAQEEVFLLRFAEDRSYDDIAKQIAERQSETGEPTEDALRKMKAAVLKRMGGVYDAFRISGQHRGKEKLLWNKLYSLWHETQFPEESEPSGDRQNSLKLGKSDPILNAAPLGEVIAEMQQLKEQLENGEALGRQVQKNDADAERLWSLLEAKLFDGAVSELIVLLHRAIGAIAITSGETKISLLSKIISQVALNIKPNDDSEVKSEQNEYSSKLPFQELEKSQDKAFNKGVFLTSLVAAEVAKRIGRRIVGFAQQPQKLFKLIAALGRAARKLFELHRKVEQIHRAYPQDFHKDQCHQQPDNQLLRLWHSSEDLFFGGILTDFVRSLIGILETLVALGYRNRLEILRYSVDWMIIILKTI